MRMTWQNYRVYIPDLQGQTSQCQDLLAARKNTWAFVFVLPNSIQFLDVGEDTYTRTPSSLKTPDPEQRWDSFLSFLRLLDIHSVYICFLYIFSKCCFPLLLAHVRSPSSLKSKALLGGPLGTPRVFGPCLQSLIANYFYLPIVVCWYANMM